MNDGLPAVGLRLAQYGGTWADLVNGALRAERLGFHTLWVNDHLQSAGRVKAEPTFEAFTTLAALAPLTGRARLGVAVLSPTHRPPALAAKMATVLDVISGGRLTIGLGSGWDRGEHEAFGIPFGSGGERVAGLRRALSVLRAMTDSPDGAAIPGVLAGAPNRPAPAQAPRPPVWVAAHGPRTRRLAVAEADGVLTAFVDVAGFAAHRRAADEVREELGRPPLAQALYTYAMPVPSEREADAWLAPEAESLATTPRALLRWLRTTGIVGPPDELGERLRELAAAGLTDAILVLPSRVPAEAVEALAEAALPPPTSTPQPPAVPAPAERANLVRTLVDVHRERGLGASPAVIDDEGHWTYDELAAVAARAAGALAARGVRPGDRVAVALPDGRPWMRAYLGAAHVGAVPVAMDPAAPVERLQVLLEDCEPAAVVAEAGTVIPGWPLLAPGELDEEPVPVHMAHAEDLAVLLYSSGSTGRPKAVMHDHTTIPFALDNYLSKVVGMGPGDRSYSVARLFSALGFGLGFWSPLGLGATSVVSPRRPTVRAVLDVCARRRVSVLTGVPTFWAQLAAFLEERPATGLESVRVALSAGEMLPSLVFDLVRERSGLEVLEGLGCSEIHGMLTTTLPGERRPGTCGRAGPGHDEIRLADEDGLPVAPGDPGRLWVRSAGSMMGYWRRREETRDVVFGPWIRLGDVLRQDEDGFFHYIGRVDDMFKVGAQWVSPVQVEGILAEHPAVREAAVVGAPDARGLTRPHAFVVLASDGAAGVADELRRHVAHRLSSQAAPAWVTAVEELPRLGSGKVDRQSLRQLIGF